MPETLPINFDMETDSVSDTVPVIVSAPLDGPFDYRFTGDRPEPGRFVLVPFGYRDVIGVVWDYAGSTRAAANRLKDIRLVLDAPAMPHSVRKMIDRAHQETLSPRGSLLKLAASVPSALEAPTRKPAFRIVPGGVSETQCDALAKPERRAVELLKDGRPRLQSEVTKNAKIAAARLRALADNGVLEDLWIEDRLEFLGPDIERSGPVLSTAQREAALSLVSSVGNGHSTILLEGVPGAGKTEVYFEALAECLRQGRRALVLLPEIALSAPWMRRFEQRFGVTPVVWHSGLTTKQRVLAWQAIARGDVPLVVGARSALFLPLGDLGLIIVDEEHDSSFKQEEGAIYHARTLAEVRARIEDCPIVLASATPSIETAVRASKSRGSEGAIDHLSLPTRFGGAPMPIIQTVDLKKDRPDRQGFLSGEVKAALIRALQMGQQSLVFLNRRGFAPLTLCRACGHRLQCPSCSAWLVSHRFRRRLMCHHCGYGVDEPEFCPACGAVDMLVASGPGVERLQDEIQTLLPDATIELLTSDQPSTSDVPKLLDRMVAGKIDVLIGTQIIAKGHHFPNLRTVIVVDADLGLAGGDLRAAERSFQLLYQVAGRAGREHTEGRVYIQTHLPDHPVIQALAAGDKDRFYSVECDEREAMMMPPFGRLAALIVSGPDAAKVRDQARKIARLAPEDEDLLVLGPAPAPLSLLRGRYRERILIKSVQHENLPTVLRSWLSSIRLPSKVHLSIDVDPISFM